MFTRDMANALIEPADHPSGMFWWGWTLVQWRSNIPWALESAGYFDHYLGV